MPIPKDTPRSAERNKIFAIEPLSIINEKNDATTPKDIQSKRKFFLFCFLLEITAPAIAAKQIPAKCIPHIISAKLVSVLTADTMSFRRLIAKKYQTNALVTSAMFTSDVLPNSRSFFNIAGCIESCHAVTYRKSTDKYLVSPSKISDLDYHKIHKHLCTTQILEEKYMKAVKKPMTPIRMGWA
jgi:hypothetical protein